MDNQLTIGQLIAFNMISGRVTAPILRLSQLWIDFQQTGVSIQRLGDILNTCTELQQEQAKAALPAINGLVEFEQVFFRYRPDAAETFKNISFTVQQGEVVGIVGRSGSGKSTLTKLLQRLHVPERGRVKVDGVDLALADTAWLRRQIGVVLQENVLFNRTIRENIALAEPGLPIELVINAAKLAGAHEFIMELPDGYDTMVGEHGVGLSGGQRQRIALARALVNNPRILILDEATSALDYESERIIQNNMAAICKGRTVIIIAHRLTALRPCSRIAVIEKGELVEMEHPAELAKKTDSYFSNMITEQRG